MRRLIVLVALVAGCADGSSVLTVRLLDDPNHAIPAIDHVAVSITDAAGHTGHATVSIGGQPLPQSFGLRFDKSVKGTLNLAVEAQAGDNTTLAAGTGMGSVTASHTSAADVQLVFGAVAPGTSKLVFVVQPSTTAAGGILKPPVQVAIQDADGNTVSTTAMVTLALGNNPSSATLSGTLTAAAVAGVATFGDLRIDANGMGYTLTASATGIDSVTSSAFDIVNPTWVRTNVTTFGGSVTCFAPATGAGAGTIYAGTELSGMFKSTDGGATWAVINSGLVTPRMRSCAVDATDANLVYAGADSGVFRSTDGGTSWSRVYAQGLPFASRGVAGYLVIADPTVTKKAWVAYGKGVATTDDGGATWNDEDSPGLTTAGGTSGSMTGLSLAVNGTARTLWLSVFVNGGVFSHVAGGTGWTKTNFGVFSNYVDAVAVDPTNPMKVVAALDADGVYVTTNAGANWAKYSTASPVYFPTNVKNADFIEISNDGKVIDVLQSATTGMGTLAHSGDGGATWGSYTFGGSTAYGFRIDPNDATGNKAWVGVQAGAFKTTNGTSFAPSNTGLTGYPVLSLAVAPSMPMRVYAGTRNAGLMTTSNGGTDWAPANGAGGSLLTVADANVNAIVVHPTDANTVFAAMGSTSGAAQNVVKTADGGVSAWSATGGGGDHSLAIGKDPMILYSGTGKSINGGSSWATSNLPATSPVQLVISAAADSTVYAIDATTFYKTTTAGASWSMATSGLPTMNATFTSLAADAAANTLYIGGYTTTTAVPPVVTGHIYKSTDGGDTWAETSTGLPAVPVLCLAAHPTAPGVVYAGTQGGGVAVTKDGGASWATNNAGLDDVFVDAIAFDPTNPTVVYAGTAGAGVFKMAP